MVEVLPVGKWTPSQALLEAQSNQDEMEMVAVVYMQKGEDLPFLTCSSMKPVDMHFLGFALQQFAYGEMKE